MSLTNDYSNWSLLSFVDTILDEAAGRERVGSKDRLLLLMIKKIFESSLVW